MAANIVTANRPVRAPHVPELITPANATDTVLRHVLDRAYVEHGVGEDGTLVVVAPPLYIPIHILVPDAMIRLKASVTVPKVVMLDELLRVANECNAAVPMARASVDLEHYSLDLAHHLLLEDGITPKTFVVSLHEFIRVAERFFSRQVPKFLARAREAAVGGKQT